MSMKGRSKRTDRWLDRRSKEEQAADRRCIDAIRAVLGMEPLYDRGLGWEPLVQKETRQFRHEHPVHGFFASGCRQNSRIPNW